MSTSSAASASASAAPDTADRIERSIHLRAPRSRVWRALSDAQEFGAWFGVDLRGQRFEPGRRASGHLTFEGYRHVLFDVTVEAMQPEALLSWRWHPYAVDPEVDYGAETPTLVVFTLEDAADGTLLRVVESGFDKVPPQRRFEAFRMNSRGWDAQVQSIRRHVEQG